MITTIKIIHQIIPLEEDCDDEKIIKALLSLKVTRKKPLVKDKNREDLVNEEEQKKPKVSSED